MVRLETPLGTLTFALYPQKAPVSVACFLAYLRGGHLAGSSFFRILNAENQARFPIWCPSVQWGWRPPGTGRRPADPRQAQPFPPIAHESTAMTGLRHRRGSLSMARRDGVVMGTEYFFSLRDSPELDFGGGRNPDGLGFGVFAQVVDGLNVLDAIHARGGPEEYVADPLPILSVREI
jgi:peptidyl-prolyl cis-trans isomerase A (cyclophilin A)